MLYNDNVDVPAVMEAMNVPEADALDYLPFGCGEYILRRKSVATPSTLETCQTSAAESRGHMASMSPVMT